MGAAESSSSALGFHSEDFHHIMQDALKLTQQSLVIRDNHSEKETFVSSLSQVDLQRSYEVPPPTLEDIGVRVVQYNGEDSLEVYSKISEGSSRQAVHRISGLGKITVEPFMLPGDNHLYFATEEGVFVINMALYRDTLFQAPIPLINISPTPVGQGVHISKIQLMRRVFSDEMKEAQKNKEKYAHLLDDPTLLLESPAFSENSIVGAGDLAIEVQDDSGKKSYFHISREELNVTEATRLLFIFLYANIISPDETSWSTINALLGEYQNEIVELVQNGQADLMSKAPNTFKNIDWVQSALSRLVKVPSSQQAFQMALAPQASGQSLIEELGRASRDEFTLGELDQSKKAYKSERTPSENSYQGKVSDEELAGAEAQFAASTQQAGERVKRGIRARANQWATVIASFVKEKVPLRALKSMATNTAVALGKASLASATLFVGVGSLAMAAKDPVSGGYLSSVGAHTAYLVGFALEQIHQTALAAWNLTQGLPSFQEAGSWRSLVVGTVSLSALQRLAVLGLNFLWRPHEARDWSLFQKFFTAGKRILARANYPIFAALATKLLKQDQLYGILEQGGRPEQTRGSLIAPWSTQNSRSRSQQTAEASMAAHDSAHKRASYIAALLLASESEEIPAEVLLLADGDNYEALFSSSGALSRLMSNEQDIPVWNELRGLIAKELYQITMKREFGVNSPQVSSEDLKPQLEKFQKLARRLKSDYEGKTWAYRWRQIKNKGKAVYKKFILDYMVYAVQQLHFSRSNMSAVANLKSTRVAQPAVVSDYFLSFAVLLPLLSAKDAQLAGKFFEAAFNPDVLTSLSSEQRGAIMKGLTMAAEQLGLNATIGFSQAERHSPRETLSEPSLDPRTNAVLVPGDLPAERQKSLKEQADVLMRETLQGQGLVVSSEEDLSLHTPNESAALTAKTLWGSLKNFNIYLDEHLSYLQKIAGTLLQGQLLISGVFMGLGFLATGLLSGAYFDMGLASAGSHFIGDLTLGFATAFEILLLKGSFAGYTVVWPYVHAATHAMNDYSSEQVGEFLTYVSDLEKGIRLDSAILRKEAYLKIKALYRPEVVGKFISGVWSSSEVNETEINAKTAALVLKYIFRHPPIAFAPNSFISFWLVNMLIGATGSTALAFWFVYEGAFDLARISAEQGSAAAWSAWTEMVVYSAEALAGTAAVLTVGSASWKQIMVFWESLKTKLQNQGEPRNTLALDADLDSAQGQPQPQPLVLDDKLARAIGAKSTILHEGGASGTSRGDRFQMSCALILSQ